MTPESEAMTAALQQGQRDHEQGWPPIPHLWGFTGWQVNAYYQGYEHQRKKERVR